MDQLKLQPEEGQSQTARTSTSLGSRSREQRADRPHRSSGEESPGRLTWLVAGLVALGALVAGAGWALSSPVGSSPDDDYHLTSIWCAASMERDSCRRIGTFQGEGPIVMVPGLVAGGACYAGNSETSGACQDEVKKGGPLESVRINTVDYPGGFYRVLNVLAGEDVERSVVTMRLFNVFLAVVLFTALALSGTRATRRLQLYALTASLIPVGWFILASVNPSGWALTGVTAFGFGLHSALLVSRRVSLVVNVVVAVLGALMAMNARGDAGIYVSIVAVSLCVLHWRTLVSRRKLLLLPLACAALGLWMGLSAAQVAGIATPTAVMDRSQAEVAFQLLVSFPLLYSGMFGYGWGLGWLDTYVPPLTAFPVVLVVGFLAVTGAARTSRSKLLALGVLGGALVAIPVITLYRWRFFVGEVIHPRYLLPLVPVLMLVTMTGRLRDRGLQMTRTQAWLIWAMLTMAHSAALHANIRRYVTGTDGPQVLGEPEWWWVGAPSPAVTWMVASLGFGVFASALVLVSNRGERRSSIGRAGPQTP